MSESESSESAPSACVPNLTCPSSSSSPAALCFLCSFFAKTFATVSASFAPVRPPSPLALIERANSTRLALSVSSCLNSHCVPKLHLPRLHQSKQAPFMRSTFMTALYSFRDVFKSFARCSLSSRATCICLNSAFASLACLFFSAMPSAPPAFANFSRDRDFVSSQDLRVSSVEAATWSTMFMKWPLLSNSFSASACACATDWSLARALITFATAT